MRERVRYVLRAGFCLVSMVMMGTIPAQASHEPFGIYEDWSTSPTMRSDRWGGSVDSAQEIKREVSKRLNQLTMRLRKEGATASDSGITSAFHRLSFVNPLSVDQVEAVFKVKSLTVTGCAANITPSRVRPVQVTLFKFNDGSSTAPGDLTGDYFGRIQVNRNGNSLDPPGTMQVQAFVFRCLEQTCSIASIVSSFFFPNLISVAQEFTLRLIWDAPNSRFLAGVGPGPDVALPYPPAATVGPPSGKLSDIRINGMAANCTTGPTVTDAEIEVDEVHTNTSATIR